MRRKFFLFFMFLIVSPNFVLADQIDDDCNGYQGKGDCHNNKSCYYSEGVVNVCQACPAEWRDSQKTGKDAITQCTTKNLQKINTLCLNNNRYSGVKGFVDGVELNYCDNDDNPCNCPALKCTNDTDVTSCNFGCDPYYHVVKENGAYSCKADEIKDAANPNFIFVYDNNDVVDKWFGNPGSAEASKNGWTRYQINGGCEDGNHKEEQKGVTLRDGGRPFLCVANEHACNTDENVNKSFYKLTAPDYVHVGTNTPEGTCHWNEDEGKYNCGGCSFWGQWQSNGNTSYKCMYNDSANEFDTMCEVKHCVSDLENNIGRCFMDDKTHVINIMEGNNPQISDLCGTPNVGYYSQGDKEHGYNIRCVACPSGLSSAGASAVSINDCDILTEGGIVCDNGGCFSLPISGLAD